MSLPNDVSGIAALTICESLLLALSDHKILPKREILAILEDVVATNAQRPEDGDKLAFQAILEVMMNSVAAGGANPLSKGVGEVSPVVQPDHSKRFSSFTSQKQNGNLADNDGSKPPNTRS